jgi:hypothetical protein
MQIAEQRRVMSIIRGFNEKQLMKYRITTDR